ncbi:MAG: beta-N-acetylglucosaminidase [Promethearchaeota archaeon]|nr:MAG: beta-N-acetylglucosaminidase [Candidatus Lokiarchaeota archaeon]
MTQKKERSFSEFSIIPEPVKIIPEDGEFILTDKTVILTDAQLKKNAEFLKQIRTQATGFNLPIKEITPRNKDSNVIILKVNDNNKKLKPEGYSLHVSPTEINISAFTPAGVFYGIQTLRQLFPVEIENSSKIDREWFVPCVNIEDSPRFSWRGFMLDESRHFFGKEVVKKLLDQMARLKLNKFHWHLTDDQGFRVEIKKYPLLTEIGSKRKGTITPQNRLDRIPVSGFYSQNDLKEIIDYAAERFITIIPEIDVPGHTTAVIASYPELSCTSGPFEVSTHWGIHKEVLCIGKEKTFEVVQDIFNEIIEIFPSDIIHTGGDETPTRRWKRCPDCQTRLKKEGLEKVGDLQVYFTNRIADYLSSQGRRLMGWNEILNEKLSKNAVCQYWTYNFDKVIDHVRNGRDVIMSEMTCVYLNYPYNIIPLSKTYQYDPIPDDLEEKYHQYILGLEACLWAELVPNNKRLEWQVFPRLIAVAETGWTPKKKKDFNSFKKRLDSYLKRLELCGINYGH